MAKTARINESSKLRLSLVGIKYYRGLCNKKKRDMLDKEMIREMRDRCCKDDLGEKKKRSNGNCCVAS